jgi:AcrR family transcriptional regulator
MTKTSISRQDKAQQRRGAIVAAALAEFTAHGFAAARIDDIAARAGVAKGTVFLHFADKQQLFEGMARAVLQPWVERIDAMTPLPGASVRATIEGLLLPLLDEIPRQGGGVIRLFISEGMRFPRLAEYYHREILSRVLGRMRVLLAVAAQRGELTDPAIATMPQLIGAPLVIGTLWHGLFERLEPLDLAALVRTQLDCLFREVG